MNIKNTIIKHYKNFFDLHAKGIALDEDDHLNIDWAEDLVKNCFIPNVMQWVAVSERLPEVGVEVWAVTRDTKVRKIVWGTGDEAFYKYWMVLNRPEPPCLQRRYM